MVAILPEAGLLVFDTIVSWGRMLLALGVSIVLSIFVGIWLARSKRAARLGLPIIDILQTLPILAFFPIAIYIFVIILPGYIGINAAVVFLIITSMLWNMIFGVYEAIKTLPTEFADLGHLYKLNVYQRLKNIYIPAALPRLSEQMSLSWAVGLFYLVTSEIFSTGNAKYQVSNGIGVALAQLGVSGDYLSYILGLVIFIAFVIATRLTLFTWFDRFANRYALEAYGEPPRRHGTEGVINAITHRLTHLFTSRNPRPAHKNETAHSRWAAKITAHSRFFEYAGLAVACAIAVVVVLAYARPGTFASVPSYELSVMIALAVSFLRVWGAFVVVLAVAIPLSIYVVFMSSHKNSYLLVFQLIASVPATILLPIIVSGVDGNAEATAFIVFFLSGIWYIVFSVIASTKYLNKSILEVKRIFRVKGWAAWKLVYLRAILPGLITGSVTAIAAEWNASIVAEQFSAGPQNTVVTSVGVGIGKLLNTTLSSGNLLLMLIALVNMTAMIILINTFIWKKLYDKVAGVYT